MIQEEHVVVVDGHAFSSNALGHKVFLLLRDGMTPLAIIETLREEGFNVSLEDILRIQKEISRRKRKKEISIKNIFSIPIGRFSVGIETLSRLIHPYVFVAVLIAHIFLILKGSLLTYNLPDYFHLIYRNPFLLLLYFSLNLAVLFVHELGHVTAAHKSGIYVEKIGVGVYLIYVVFYTDVTQSWLLNKQQRLLIDSGGLYFQLLLSLCFLTLVYLSEGAIAIFFGLLFWDNLLIMLFNINPFAMFDGYWILSDFFNIKNLRTKSFLCFSELLLSPFQKVKFSQHFAVYLYSILNISFLVILYSLASSNLFLLIKQFIDWSWIETLLFREKVFFLLKVLFFSFTFGYFSKMIFFYSKTIVRHVYSLRREVPANQGTN